jgi:hypothetical protein
MRHARAGNHLSDRWNGQVPWSALLWRDMLGIGTLVNLAATFLAVIAAIQDAPIGLVAFLHFAPLPYNFFLLAALWRLPRRPQFAVAIGAVWFLLILVV